MQCIIVENQINLIIIFSWLFTLITTRPAILIAYLLHHTIKEYAFLSLNMIAYYCFRIMFLIWIVMVTHLECWFFVAYVILKELMRLFIFCVKQKEVICTLFDLWCSSIFFINFFDKNALVTLVTRYTNTLRSFFHSKAII